MSLEAKEKSKLTIEEGREKVFNKKSLVITNLSHIKVNTPQNHVVEMELVSWILTRALARGPNQIAIRVLTGPPGVGKTYSLTTSLDVLKKLGENRGGEGVDVIENAKKLIELMKEKGIIDEEEKGKIMNSIDGRKELNRAPPGLRNYIKHAFDDLIKEVSALNTADITEEEKESFADHYTDILKSYNSSLFTINRVLRRMKEKEQLLSKILEIAKSTQINLVVLPSLSSPSEVMLNTSYVVNPETIIEKKVELEILRVAKGAFTGKPTILVLDEISELVKESKSKNVKQLHDFMDFVLRQKSITIPLTPSELKEKDRETIKEMINELEKLDEELRMIIYGKEETYKNFLNSLKELKEKVEEESNETFHLYIPFPSLFYVIGTGNVRDESSPVGYLQSTENRIIHIKLKHVFPHLMKSFIEEFKEKIIKELKGEGELLDSRVEEALNMFCERLAKEYKEIYNLYQQADGKARNIPSYRNITHLITTYTSFLLNKKELESDVSNLVEKVFKAKSVFDIRERGSILEIEEEGPRFSIGDREFAEFLIGLLRVNSVFDVSSFTIQAEIDEYRIEEIREKLDSTVRNMLSSHEDKGYLVKITNEKGEEEKLLYNKTMMLYLSYLFLTMKYNKKPFTLFIGESQEGKTTLALNLPYVMFDNVIVSRLPPSELTFETSNLENKKGKIDESGLVKILRDAKKHPERTYVIVVNEIDNKGWTQELNALLERGEANIDGKTEKFNNVLIVGSMNLSSQILDNFLSRAGAALYFSPSVSSIEEGDKNVVPFILLYEVLNKNLPEYKEEINKLISMMWNLDKELSVSRIRGLEGDEKALAEIEEIIYDIKEGRDIEFPLHSFIDINLRRG